MHRLARFFLVWIIIAGLAVTVSAAPLRTMTGTQLADILRENSGKIILINFFASWCPPCRVEIPDLIELRRSYPEDKLIIIGISVDEDMDSIKAFIKKTGFNYPVYITDFRLPTVYAVSGIPHNVLYLPSGKIAYSEGGILTRESLEAFFKSILKETQ